MDLRRIEKFFKKECTPEEVRQLMEWFRYQQIHQDQEDDIFRLWEELEEEVEDLQFSRDSKALLAAIHQQIKEENDSPIKIEHTEKAGKRRGAYWLKAAAVLVVGVLFAALFIYTIQNEEAEKVPELIVLEAPVGIKLTKVLPDGSKVVLNSNSSIVYTEGFSESKREVTLVGEGFFQITRDPSRPFIVHTGNLSTTALGTAFNVSHHEADSIAEISLVTGKVRLGILSKEGIKTSDLLPGERATYQSATGSIQVGHFDVQEVLAWKEGVLYFKETDFRQVVQRLEEWYGVMITVEGNHARTKSNDWSYTGRFENESLDNVLTGIGFVKDFNYEINGKDVKLMFN